MEFSMEAVIEAKRDHCRAIITQLEALSTLIDSEPQLWFGGLPPLLVQTKNYCSVQKDVLRNEFGIEE